MTFEEFDKLYDQLIADTLKMRDTKGREYTKNNDRLETFKGIAEELDIHPLVAWYTFFNKHIRAINTFVRDVQAGSWSEKQMSEPIRGRFIDAIVYLGLGYGLAVECGFDVPPILTKQVSCYICRRDFSIVSNIYKEGGLYICPVCQNEREGAANLQGDTQQCATDVDVISKDRTQAQFLGRPKHMK